MKKEQQMSRVYMGERWAQAEAIGRSTGIEVGDVLGVCVQGENVDVYNYRTHYVTRISLVSAKRVVRTRRGPDGKPLTDRNLGTGNRPLEPKGGFTARQIGQVKFLESVLETERKSGHDRIHIVKCQDCEEQEEFWGAEGAIAFIKDHAGQRTWHEFGPEPAAAPGGFGPQGVVIA
jgi:hypothetical protein